MFELESLFIKIALIGVLGIGAQWLAWRTGRPAIALMLLAGIIAGPVLGLIDPKRDFGPLNEPIIKLAVAVILFEGGLSLRFSELRNAGSAVVRLVLIGVPLGWALGSAAAYYGAGLSLEVSLLFGGILVVTGPTVIGPLLRSLNIEPRVKNMLKWEGIVNDPIGALLAIGIYAYITHSGPQSAGITVTADVVAASFLAALLGGGIGYGLTWAFPRGLVPEYLKSPILLVMVIAGFVLSDIVMHETGLITVTVMGVVMANREMQSSHVLRRFKEDLTVLLVSGLFILLSATLDWEVVSRFQLRFVLFLLLLLFVVRPLTIFTALLFSDIPWRERAFVAWIAPRGIVAVAITGLFALRLSEYGVEDADALIPLSFAVVIVTIVAHSFTAGNFARWLGIDRGQGGGLLLVGAHGWTIGFAEFLRAQGLTVLIVDSAKRALRRARQAGVPTYHGDIMAEVEENRVDMGLYQQLIAATDNDSYNALVCSEFAHQIGPNRVSRLISEASNAAAHRYGRILTIAGTPIEELLDRLEEGWTFSSTRITEKFTYSQYVERMKDYGGDTLAVVKGEAKGREDKTKGREAKAKGREAKAKAKGQPNGGRRVELFSMQYRPSVNSGDYLFSFVPPPDLRRKREAKANAGKPQREAKANASKPS